MSHVASENDFSELWPQLWKLLDRADFLAAHNASFDQRVLLATCEHYELEPPPQRFLCTVALARKVWSIRPTRLPDVCESLDIPLSQHHDALQDARACAKIVIRAIEEAPTEFDIPLIENKQVKANSYSQRGSKMMRENQQMSKPNRRTRDSAPNSSNRPNGQKTEANMTKTRTKELGDWGESVSLKLLRNQEFKNVQDLNAVESNHPFADIYGERLGNLRIV